MGALYLSIAAGLSFGVISILITKAVTGVKASCAGAFQLAVTSRSCGMVRNPCGDTVRQSSVNAENDSDVADYRDGHFRKRHRCERITVYRQSTILALFRLSAAGDLPDRMASQMKLAVQYVAGRASVNIVCDALLSLLCTPCLLCAPCLLSQCFDCSYLISEATYILQEPPMLARPWCTRTVFLESMFISTTVRSSCQALQ